MTKNKKIILGAIALFLCLCIGILAYLLMQSNQDNKEMVALFEIEKEEMENEYSNFASQYDELQVRINNDSLLIKLENEKVKT